MKNIALQYHCNSTRGKLTAIEVLFEYTVANLCIKSDPLQLIPVVVPIGSSTLKLEDCAMVGAPDDKHFEIFPLNKEFIPQITKGIIMQHPELNIEMQKKEADDDPDILLVTMPEMTKTRRDALKEVVKAKYEQIKGQMEQMYAEAVAEATKLGPKIKPEELEECKNELKKVHDDMLGVLKDKYNETIEYIEKEYQAHCAEKEEKQRKSDEDTAATDKSVAQKIKL